MKPINATTIALGALVFLYAVTGCENTQKQAVEPEIPIRAEAFELSDVQLLQSPFRHAMQRNAEYLLFLEPDRFLAWFRREAGLEPKAEVYGGWESQGYILSGHSLGHYLSALSKQYRSTGDERFREKLDYTVGELAAVQQAHGDGYLLALPEGRETFEEISNGNIRPDGFSLNGSNVPWYVLDKMFHGLTDAYLLGGNEQALEVAVNLAGWADEVTGDLTGEQWQEMLSVEFGGMIHSLADLYAITGDPAHLELAEKFYHHEVLDPLADRRDALEGLHGNTQIPKVRGVARIHELTGNRDYRTIAEYFWNQVVSAHTYVNGGHGHEEYFGPPNQLSDRLSNTTETCNTYNMLWLTRMLFAWEAEGRLMDYYERALFNHILASQNPETGMFKYKGYLDMPAHKYFSDPTDSFWCCVGSGMENHTNYGEDIYHHTDQALYVNLFIASELEWEEKGLHIRQETEFPAEEGTRLTVSAEQPTELSLLLREPRWWGGDMAVRLNGEEYEYQVTEEGYVEMNRTFEDGDTIEIDMSMELRMESMPDDDRRVAFFYGPVLLNAVLDEDPPAGILGEDPPVPQLVGSESELLDALEPVEGEPLRFRAENVVRIQNEETGQWETTDLYFKPHYRTVDALYTVYLDRHDN